MKKSGIVTLLFFSLLISSISASARVEPSNKHMTIYVDQDKKSQPQKNTPVKKVPDAKKHPKPEPVKKK